MINSTIRNLFRTGLAAVFLLSIWGCSSISGSTAENFASVKIRGQEPIDIARATVKVFEDEGYYKIYDVDGEAVFEKEAGEWDQAAYGSNISSMDDTIMNQVKVQIVDLGKETYRVECTAYIIQNEGTAREHKIRLRRPRSGYYRDLMDRIAATFTVKTITTEN